MTTIETPPQQMTTIETPPSDGSRSSPYGFLDFTGNFRPVRHLRSRYVDTYNRRSYGSSQETPENPNGSTSSTEFPQPPPTRTTRIEVPLTGEFLLPQEGIYVPPPPTTISNGSPSVTTETPPDGFRPMLPTTNRYWSISLSVRSRYVDTYNRRSYGSSQESGKP